MGELRLHSVPSPGHTRPVGRRSGPVAREPLWRHLLGEHLRRLRLARRQTLTETAAKAGVSPQYLSEMERGVKEPSSEMIAAVAGALGVRLLDLTVAVSRDLSAQQAAGVTSSGSVTTATPRVLAMAA